MKLRRATAVGLSVAAAFGAGCLASLGALIPPLPQILPIPQIGGKPSTTTGSGPKSPPPKPGNPTPQGVPSCKRQTLVNRRSRHIKHPRVRIGNVTDAFRSSMFGIAAGGQFQNESCAARNRDLNDDAQAGARWLRIDINWAQIQDGGRSSYAWGPIDRVVNEARAHHMRVLGTIVFTPRWARPKDTTAVYGPSPTTYGTFAGIAARHYARLGVGTFEIWNEPNSTAFWTPAPDPAAYTADLKAAYAAIKHAVPSATVLTGGLAPAVSASGSYSPLDFLNDIYAAGGGGSFDAVAAHPYSWPAPPGAPLAWSAWYQMYGTTPSLRSLMTDHGDGAKKIWATEFGAPTGGPSGSFVSRGQQAALVLLAYKLFATYPWAGPLFVYQGRDLGTNTSTNQNFFGLETHDFELKPSYRAYLAASSAVARSTHP